MSNRIEEVFNQLASQVEASFTKHQNFNEILDELHQLKARLSESR